MVYDFRNTMKKKWFPATDLPPQGYKILCKAGGGDYYVAQRFGPYWVPIPFPDSKFAKLDPPDFWSHIDFEGDNKGYYYVLSPKKDSPMTFDELEKYDPKLHIELCEAQYTYWKVNRIKTERK